MNLNKMVKVVTFCLFLLMIVGCNNGPKPEEEIYTVLEEVVKLEDSFKEQQNPLVELEQTEKKLYDEIISLSMKDFEKIVSLSKEALVIVEERKQRINNEYESIKESQEKFKTTNDYIEQIEDEKLKEEALALIEVMNNRYDSYEELYNYYTEAISYDLELYNLFQEEDLSIDVLQSQIDKINKSYDQVIVANEKFNEYTESYNEAKISFYKNAGLDIVYEDQSN